MARRGYWPRYVPVAERREKARKRMKRLQKKGLDIRPVEIEGRKIAHTFWGKAWCDHIESFSDYANRLPRGRTYVRNGSVCHLDIEPGEISAMVSGTQIYNVTIGVDPLPSDQWEAVRKRCAGRIGSILELLEGRFSENVMDVVTDRKTGLFPLPGQIHLDCSCPDWATMCKHVAAVLYGVGARLDEAPELLFRLRNVDHEELIQSNMDVSAAETAPESRRRIAEDALGDVFGIEMDADGDDAPEPVTPRKKKAAAKKTSATAGGSKKSASETADARNKSAKSDKTARKSATRGKPAKSSSAGGKSTKRASAARKPRLATGSAVARLRDRFDMTQSEFAELLGVSPATVSNWENRSGRLNLQARTREAWDEVSRMTRDQAWTRLDEE